MSFPPLSEPEAAASPQATPDPALPRMAHLDDGRIVPAAPENLSQTGVDPSILANLALKQGATVPNFTTEWATHKLRLPLQLVEEIFWQMKQDRLVEVLGQTGPLSYRYAATQRGRQLAAELMEISGYLGPAPVSLESYSAMMLWQSQNFSQVHLDQVTQELSELVLPDEYVEVAALAASSGRSLFVFGPAGNGKTSLGKALHRVFAGDLWIPRCMCVEHNMIRLFDAHLHEEIDPQDATLGGVNHRWVRIHRPFVISGGEMTMKELDLAFSPSLRYYEAPPHVKANGGTFMIDDFGRQRIEPHELLNRWIIPLESRVDHLGLVTGQKIQIPFELMLIVATNLSVNQVADPAFLRRMGYRLLIDKPTPENYRRIFANYADRHNISIQEGLLDKILERYQSEERDLRASEPRDLLERTKDVCRLSGEKPHLDEKVLNIAWRGYFGNAPK